MDFGPSCGINLPGQTDIVLGTSLEINVTELNQAGYNYDLCYSCEIQEIATSIMFTYTKQIII